MRRIAVLSLAVVLGVELGSFAHASFIVAPTLGNRDTSMSGNTVAVLTDAGSILFHNRPESCSARRSNVSAMFFSPTFRNENPEISYSGKSDGKPLGKLCTGSCLASE